jgi:hypothetical protein
VVELVDALASGASVRKDVEVRVLSWAPIYFKSLKSSKGASLARQIELSHWLEAVEFHEDGAQRISPATVLPH